MTDEELIERLRDWPYQGETMAGEAADRIEALTKERDEANKRGDAWRFRADIAEVKLAKAVEALAPLAAIADAFDANELDDEARKFWGQHSFNTTPHEDIELYQGRGGRQLLTLANCMFARTTLAEIKGESHE